MEYLNPLNSTYWVDKTIEKEEDRLVIIRYGDNSFMLTDHLLRSVEESVKEYAVIYSVDKTVYPDFNREYELWYDPCAILFFFRNKHVFTDRCTGNQNDHSKITPGLTNEKILTDIIHNIYRHAKATD